MIGLHEELKVEISESDYRKLGTLGDLARYLSDHLK
jgi:acyl carrier protein